MRKSILSLLVIALMALVSCGNKYVLSPEELEDLLLELHFAEGMALQKGVTFNTPEDKVDLYQTVYSKYGIDKERFDSTMTYYTDDPFALSTIYANVYARIEVLERKIQAGDYALSKSLRSKNDYTRMQEEDAALLPYIKEELWMGRSTYSFVSNDFKPFEKTIELDSISGKMNLRFAMKSDSIQSAQCNVSVIYDDNSDDFNFEFEPLADSLVSLEWEVKGKPEKVKVTISTEKMNDNASCDLSIFRMYVLGTKKKNLSLF